MDEGRVAVFGRRRHRLLSLALLVLADSAAILLPLWPGHLSAPAGPHDEASPDWTTRLEVLHDPSRALTLADILAAEQAVAFTPVPGHSINPGFTRAASWLRLTVTGTRDETVLLAMKPNFVDLIDVYIGAPGDEAGAFTHLAMGDHRPLPPNAIAGLDDVVPLVLTAGGTTRVYIRIAAVSSALGLSVDLYRPADHTVRATVAGLAYGGWFGGMAVLLVIQLVFYAFDRKPYYGLRSPRCWRCWSILWLGLALTLAQRAGFDPMPEWVTHAYAVGCLVQTILLTGSLGVRLRAAEALNRLMRERALEAARAAEQRAIALVAERTRELAAAKQLAEEALAAELASQQRQVRFMEVISHQYRTPLAVIGAHVDNIGLSLPPEDTDNRRRLDRVRRGIARLVQVLEVNLSRSRFEGPAFQPELQPAILADIANEAARRGRDLLQHAILLEIAPAAGEARVMADAQMIGIAIINLLENAVKYTPRGRAPVTLSCTVDGMMAVIAVADKGVGIAKADRNRVFDRFVRGSNAGGVDGLGLGLSLVSRIVTMHGGRVTMDSRVGEGTTVRIVLPLLGAAPVA